MALGILWIQHFQQHSLLCTLIIIISHVQRTYTRTAYLFSAEPKGGISSVSVDSMRAGTAYDLANNSLSNIEGQISTISYDDTSGYLITTQERPSEILLHTPLCRNPNKRPILVFNASTTFPIFDVELRGSTSDCLSCKAGPFALFDNKIYFILTGDFGLAPLTRKVVQLRVLQTCGDCALDLDRVNSLKVFKTPFLFNCSKIVAEVYSEALNPVIDVRLKAGQGLKVIKTELGLQFFFQIFLTRWRRKHAHAELILYRATDSGHVYTLHTETLDYQYAHRNIHALASVDYKDGLLCWSAADRMYCGEINEYWKLGDVHRLLFPGEGAAQQICKGPIPNLLLYITGVAISEAWNVWGERVIFFGCFAQRKGIGGTGMIKVSTDGKNKQIFAVRTAGGEVPIHSGSMFITQNQPGKCPGPGRLDICLDPPKWVNKPEHLLGDNPSPIQTTSDTMDEGYKLDNASVRTDPEIIVVEAGEEIEFEPDATNGHMAGFRSVAATAISVILSSLVFALILV